jgi:hypothetical protein
LADSLRVAHVDEAECQSRGSGADALDQRIAPTIESVACDLLIAGVEQLK